MAKNENTDPIAAAIVRADTLLGERRSIQAELQQARDFLNDAKGLGILTDEQAAWVDANLARRTRTRKAADAPAEATA